jgi:hypothetical protein
VRHAVGTREELRDVARRDGTRGAHVGAHVDPGFAAQRGDRAVALAGDLDFHLHFARVRRDHEVLEAVLGPLERPAQAHRGEGHEVILGREFAALAEAAADVALDQVDALFRQVELVGEDAAVLERHLRRPAHRELGACAVPDGEHRAQLHGGCDVPLHPEALAPHVRRAHAARVAFRRGIRHHDVALRFSHERRQRLEVELDRLGRVLAERAALGDHHRDRLADVAHGVFRHHRLLVGTELGKPHKPHRDPGELAAAGKVRRGVHRVHSRHAARSRRVDAADRRVRARTAQERGVQHAGNVQVVGELAAAAQQAQILHPLDRTADRLSFLGHEIILRGTIGAPCRTSSCARRTWRSP